MKRKTINIQTVIHYSNAQLARTDDFATREFKVGVAALLEKILHESCSYQGFMYLDNDDCEQGSDGEYRRKYLE